MNALITIFKIIFHLPLIVLYVACMAGIVMKDKKYSADILNKCRALNWFIVPICGFIVPSFVLISYIELQYYTIWDHIMTIYWMTMPWIYLKGYFILKRHCRLCN
jgi:hypothetical protein